MTTSRPLPHPDDANRPVWLRAHALGFATPGLKVFGGLSFAITPGLSFVRGDEGRGKTTLLRLLAGEIQPTSGRLERAADADVFWTSPPEDPQDPVTARQWLQQQSARFSRWQPARLEALIDGFELEPHLDKALFMLSTGSRRKVWLAAAFACGARLTLLEKPYAALDARSRSFLSEQLREAARDPQRAWVVADYEVPAGLASAPLAGVIELG